MKGGENMNFMATERIMDFTDKFIPKSQYLLQTEGHKDYLGRSYTADYVEIINQSPYHISFEVVENEIIVFCFGDHIHFEDYSFELEEGDPDYVDRAIEFLTMFFRYPIERRYTSKGNKVVRDETLLVVSEEEKESICATYFCTGLKNLFKQRIETVKRFAFDNETKSFREVQIP